MLSGVFGAKHPLGFFGKTLRMTRACVILNAVKDPQGILRETSE